MLRSVIESMAAKETDENRQKNPSPSL
jgi:hypothetical protein